MRYSLPRTASQPPQRVTLNCMICNRLLSSVPQLPSLSRCCQYSNFAKDSDIKEDAESARSTDMASDDPGVSTNVSPEHQEPTSSQMSSQHSSPSTIQKPNSVKQPWRFKMPPPPLKDPAARSRELSQAMSETSLRKKLVWRAPFLGVNPAYDIALSYLREDRRKKIAAIHRLGIRIARERKSTILSKFN